jgi:hypothetical protein
MAITKEDIKALKAVRMSDTPDGGGRMSAEVLISGEDNNLFDDVSALARVYGEVSLRKLFPAVLTNTRDKYLGARVIIDKPPADPNVHGLLFGASSLFDVRAEAQSRLESYLTEGPNASLLLYGPHIAGTANVALIKQVANNPPVEGDVYVLKKEGFPIFQYVRVTKVEVVRTTFSDGVGDFERDVVTLTISDPLRFDFPGWNATRYDTNLSFTGRTRILTTVVADAAQYYGIRPLAIAASAGSFTVRADSSFSNLLPSAQIESPIALALPYADARLPVPGISAVTYNNYDSWNASTTLFLPGGVRPGTLLITVGGTNITDFGGKLLAGGLEIGSIDYPNGILALFETSLSGYKQVTFQPAAYVLRAPQSTEVSVTDFGRRLNYTGVIDPIPQPGTLSLSYLSQGRWYTLTDQGAGVLRGLDTGYGGGTINGDTGAFLVTLGALPDMDSSLIFTWNAPTQETAQPVLDRKASQTIQLALDPARTVQPGTFTATWIDGVTKTATAAATGVLSGAATGSLSVSSGTVVFAPNVLPPYGTELTLEYVDGPKQSDEFPYPSRDGIGFVNVIATLGAIAPGSLEVEWNTFTELAALGVYTAAQLFEMGIDLPAPASPARVDPIHIARDNGSGVVVLPDGTIVGSVNYATGLVKVLPDLTLSLPAPRYTSVASGGGRFRLNYSGMNHILVPTLFPPDESGWFKLRYNSPGATNNRTETVLFAPAFKVVPGSSSPLVAGSVLFKPDGVDTPWSDSGSGVLRTRTPSGWLNRGSINYITGMVTMTGWVGGQVNNFQRLSATTTLGENISSEFVFRTAAAPLRPGSVTVQFARTTGGTQNVTVPTNGIISATGISGKVDHEAGIIRIRFGTTVVAGGNEGQPWYNAANVDLDGNIFKPAPVATSTIKYSATAYSYLPLDASILGLDPVRLPTDGRVPVFKSGRVIVIHHTSSDAPQVVTNGQTVDLGLPRLARIRVFGADGLEINSGHLTSLDAGTITFLDTTGYSQPVTIEKRVEDEALCAEAQITGELRLTRPLTHDFPLGSYVSSAYVQGTLQSAAQETFSQETWTNNWSDTRIGFPILSQYNDTTSPLVVTNAGAITERWACIFQNNTTFQLVGENTGQILVGTTGAGLSPINPATGVPYFTLLSSGWGSGWVAGNVLRFNTKGANFPLWVSRTVMQSPAAPPGTDQLVISIRGDIDQ